MGIIFVTLGGLGLLAMAGAVAAGVRLASEGQVSRQVELGILLVLLAIVALACALVAWWFWRWSTTFTF